jgi:hypothetical protein
LTADAPIPAVGARLTAGTLYRRVSNTHMQWDLASGRPTKGAFRPDKDRYGQLEEGVSFFLASLTTPEAVLNGHDGYGLVSVDITELLALAKVKKETVAVKFDPSTDGAAGPAHCYVEGLYGPMQKALAKQLAKVVVSASPEQASGVKAPEQDEDS